MMGWEALKIILKDHLGSLAIPSTLLGEGREALSPIRWFMFFLKRIKISKKQESSPGTSWTTTVQDLLLCFVQRLKKMVL